jgi:hypothetical protein
MDLLDEIVGSGTFNEKKAGEAILYVKRKEFLKKIETIITTLTKASKINSSSSTETANVMADGGIEVERVDQPEKIHTSIEVSVFDLSENMLVVNGHQEQESQEKLEKRDENDILTIRVVYDGEQNRVACKYAVKYPISSEEASTLTASENGNEKWHVIDLASSEHEEMKQFVMNPSTSQSESSLLSSAFASLDVENDKLLAVKLVDVAEVDANQQISLHDRQVISKSEDHELAHIIATDQKAYSMLMDSIYGQIHKIMSESDLLNRTARIKQLRPEWKKTNLVYQKQQSWKRIGH